MYEDSTTKVLTEGICFGPRAQMVKPREGYRLRIIEERIPAEELPVDRTKGAPRRPGP